MKKYICGWLIFILLAVLIGCGIETGAPVPDKGGAAGEYAEASTEGAEAGEYAERSTDGVEEAESPGRSIDGPEESESPGSTENEPEEAESSGSTEDGEGTEESSGTLDEDGSYDSADEVALYLVTYHHLPGNYITKGEARKLGWQGGSLEEYAPGKCIGGDTFGNREGQLPADHKYHECDIGTLGEAKRGKKRLVYSEDFKIYYTEDHYASFTQLY